jgi:hypothetical protein
MVCDGKGRLMVCLCLVKEVGDKGGAVKDGILCMNVKVNERRHEIIVF